MKFKQRIRGYLKDSLVHYAYLKGFFRLGSLPAFIIIGAQKGGTTSLYQYLTYHPQILGSNMKEVQFFSLYYNRGVQWYKACFPANLRRKLQSRMVGGPVITGEASPFYIFHPTAPQLIAKTLPEVKLIVLLRNPVDRLISHYHHMVRIGRENLSIQEAVRREEERLQGEYEKIRASASYSVYTYATYSYLARGRYIEQLDRYAEYFSRDRMLILKSEDFFTNTQVVYDQVLKFLGLAPYELTNLKPKNKGNYRKEENSELRLELNQYFKPFNENLYEFLGDNLGW